MKIKDLTLDLTEEIDALLKEDVAQDERLHELRALLARSIAAQLNLPTDISDIFISLAPDWEGTWEELVHASFRL